MTPAAAWPPCSRTDEYARWAAVQLASAPILTDAQRAQIVAAVVADQRHSVRAS